MKSELLARLRRFLCPPGRGVYVHSTGGQYSAPLLKRLYKKELDVDVNSAWARSLEAIPDDKKRVLLLGIPSDTGAGMLRGSNFGPLGVRLAFLRRFKKYPDGLLDVGDVLCVPQLLHDDMLNDDQLRSTRAAIYDDAESPLPVSPLSVAAQVYELLWQLNPNARIVMLGGDHGVTWTSMLGCRQRFGKDFGLLQIDAHDDLSENRQGIKHCYSTWAYHTVKMLKPNHVVQVGLRNSNLTKDEWLRSLPVKQIWIDEIPGNAIEDVVKHLSREGIRNLYISNDIDGTDPRYAPSTGTPEPGGLTPRFVKNLIRAVCKHFHVIGGDVMEVAPPLSASHDFARDKTCRLGADYLHALCQGINW